VLDPEAGKGLSVAMAWLPGTTNPQLRVVCEAHARNNLTVVQLHVLQLNHNRYGIGLAQEFPPTELRAGGGPTDMTLHVNCSNPKQPVGEIQVALKADPVGVLFFTAPPVPTALLMRAAPQIDAAQYAAEFAVIAVSWTLPDAVGPRVAPSALQAHVLKQHGWQLLHTQTQGPLLGMHLHGVTTGDVKVYAEVTTEGDNIVIANVKCTDAAMGEIMGKYIMECMAR
jgi:hypothetical protein